MENFERCVYPDLKNDGTSEVYSWFCILLRDGDLFILLICFLWCLQDNRVTDHRLKMNFPLMTFLEGDIETAVQVCYFAISSYLETLSGMVIILIKTVKLISSLRSLVLPWSNKSCCKNLLNLLAHLLDNFQSSVFARSSISSFVEHFSRKSRWVLGSALFKWTVRISFLLELLSIWC